MEKEDSQREERGKEMAMASASTFAYVISLPSHKLWVFVSPFCIGRDCLREGKEAAPQSLYTVELI